MLGAPGFEETKNFPQKSDNLNIYSIKKCKDFLFCSINGEVNINEILLDIKLFR